MNRPYTPKNTIQASQFGVASLRRITLQLGPTDAANGKIFPEVQGKYVFVERCDYPFLASFVQNGTGRVETSFVLREGDVFAGDFKGLTLYGPASVGGVSGTAGPVVSLLVGDDETAFENALATLQSHYGGSSRAVTNTGVSQTVALHVPSGLRRVLRLEMSTSWTTLVALPLWFFSRLDGSGTCSTPPVTANGVVYGAMGQSGLMQYNAGAVATSGVFSVDNLVIPPDAGELGIAFTGTGLTPPNVRAVWQ